MSKHIDAGTTAPFINFNHSQLFVASSLADWLGMGQGCYHNINHNNNPSDPGSDLQCL